MVVNKHGSAMKAARKSHQPRWMLILALSLAAVHGLIYIFLVPPWQHYDEPNHFEVAWLIANQGRLPVAGDESQDMRREVASSMIEHGFFEGMGFLPDLNQTDQPIWIGTYSQIGQPPLYYILAAAPAWLLRSFDVTTQLISMRFLSLGLFLLTVVAAHGLISEITAPGHPLRWIVPVSLALLPGLTDSMTSVNSDAAAIAVFSLFLWGCVRSITRGVNLLRLLWIVGAAVLCFLAKETAYIAVILMPLALLFAILRTGAWRWAGWGVCLAVVISGGLAVFGWGEAATWLRWTNQSIPTRSASASAPLGEYIFELQATAGDAQKGLNQLYQLLPPKRVTSLRGQTVSIGAWIWASQPVQLTPLTLTMVDLQGIETRQTQPFTIGETPVFYSFSTTVPDEASRGWILLSATAPEAPEVTVFFDGLVLAEGQFALSEVPAWDNSDGNMGTWGGQRFENLVRNPSAEAAGIGFRAWVDRLGEKILPAWERPSMVLYSLQDRAGAGWYSEVTAQNLLRTFWGKFGWGHVLLLGSKTYLVLGVVTAIGALGTILALGKLSKKTLWEALFFLGVATLSIWAFAWMRGSYYLIYRTFIPAARYAFPVIIPTLAFFWLGWVAITQKLSALTRMPNKIWVGLYGLFGLGVSALSMASIIVYYYG